MSDTKYTDSNSLYKRIKLLSNKKKFEILRAVETTPKNIKELSKELKLAYNKCSNYVSELEKEKFVVKEQKGRYVYIKSNSHLSDEDLKPDK